MKNKKIILYAAGLIVIITALILITRNIKEKKINATNPEFAKYVTAYTSGIISKNDPVQIKLTSLVTDKIKNKEQLPEKLFEFSPSINGKYSLINNTIEFIPEKPFESGTEYIAEFNLGKLTETENKLETFIFKFKTIKQTFDYRIEEQKTIDKKKLKYQQITGTLNTADAADPEAVKQILTIEGNNKKYKIKWSSDIDNTKHTFIIDSIERFNKPVKILLKWDGESIGAEKKDETEITIPAIGDFNLISSKVTQYPEQYLQLQFTDPLDETQNLNGLISVEGINNLRYIIDDNNIKVYANERINKIRKVKIFEGIKNVLGYKLTTDTSFKMAFEALKPEVKFLGKGTILPSGKKGLILPFEAVNLKAVDVTVIKIYESNIMQFLQDNEIEGNYNLRQVAKPIIRKKLDLTEFNVSDFGVPNRYSLDLNKIINTEPGAVYRIELNFKKQYSLYPCNQDNNTETDNEEITENINEDIDWDNYEYDEYDDYDYYYFDYWEDRDNPCKKAYYGNKRKAAKNIIASDLGLTAKQSQNGNISIFTSDLLTTKPKSGVAIEIYDYQQQLLASGNTDPDGMLTLTDLEKPYFIIAKHGTQRAYLKLSDGNTLSLSKFDISGVKVEKGIKGYIYGERGVWRPGDTIFTTFILNDEQNNIPEGHPLIFKFINPQGKLVKKEIQYKNKTGFYPFFITSDKNAVTGNYTVKVSVGTVNFDKTIKIETIKPNRLKINLKLNRKILKADGKNTATINIKHLHGTPGKNLKVKTDASLYPVKTVFKGYSDYNFDNPVKKYNTRTEEIFNGKTDENGNIKFNINFFTENSSPGMLNAVFFTKAFENGGNFSIDQYSVPYSPYNSYVGIKVPEGNGTENILFTDKKHKIETVILTPEGKPVKEKRLINVKLYKLNRRWWFDENNNISSYNFRNSATLIKDETITTYNGKATRNIKVGHSDWGQYLIIAEDPVSGHSTGKIIFIDWPYWSGHALKADAEGAAMLKFVSDKDKYYTGDKAVITIPSGKNGRALINIESGTKILKSFWIETEEGETKFDFKLTKEMTPNIYVSVTLLQPHNQTANDLPIRMYGTIPLMVEDPETRLKPEIKMQDKIESDKKFNITISEQNGKEMTYTLAVVDEGLLDLTRFKTPDPAEKFFAKEALGIKTWDMFDQVIGAYGGKIERLLAVGGGADEEPITNGKALRFKPVVKFLGPFTIKKRSSDTHTLKIKNYTGSVRVMVVAGNNKAYGSAEKTVTVTKPLMITASLPRILAPGETVKLPVSIFTQKNNIKNVTISVKTNNIFTVNGQNRKTITFNNPGEQFETFELKVRNKTGKGKVTLNASSGNYKAEYEINIDIRNPNPKINNISETVLQAGETKEINYATAGIEGTNSGTLEVSSVPPINLEKRLKFLMQYPYGCVEQTTSAVFPQLYLPDLADLSEKQRKQTQYNIKEGIKRLSDFQLPSGAFAYWQNSRNVSVWGTNYAGHFIIEAKKKGYAVPASMIKSWKKYQKNKAKNWTNDGPSSQLQQAYRLYTLALAGDAEKSAMNRMKNISNISTAAKWRLAAAYFVAGKKTTAKNMIAGLNTNIKKYNELSNTFGSDIRDKAMILETLTLTGNKTLAFKLLKEISEKLSENTYMSTQTTAYALMAVSEYNSKNISEGIKYDYSVNSGKFKSVNSNKSVLLTDLNIKKTGNGKIKIKNTGNGMLYIRIIMQGIPETGKFTDAEKDLRMSVKYYLPDGTYINPENINQGTDFIAEVTISHPGIQNSYENMALTQIFPSGWEIINTRLYNTGYVSYGNADNIDIRDDRIYTYFDLPRGRSKTFRVLLNASYAGKFVMPPINCEAMYDPGIFARKGGTFVTVK
ncbi:MAG: hypothetical protein GXO50_08255 [Chlorobi bacterium]|nr:hypothetical protein [Chlorobiota bacterium]